MTPLNIQQRRVLIGLIVLLLTGLALRIADRHRQAINLDINGILDGYKYTSEVNAAPPEIEATTNVTEADSADKKPEAPPKKASKPKSGSSKITNKVKPSEKINVNKADEKELQRLPGIGPVLALRIIAYRDSAGAYIEPEDLMNVKGIGEKKLAKMEPYLEF